MRVLNLARRKGGTLGNDRLFRLSGIMLILAALACGAAGCAGFKTTLRYRLTVVVDTPNGVRSGSSVVEATGSYDPGFPGSRAGLADVQIRGEATPVSLGNGKYLFAVFSWVDPPTRILTMLTVPFKDQLPPISPDPTQTRKTMMLQFRALANARGIRDVNKEDWPVIATFANLKDPYSIRIAPATELATVMPGYQIIRMTVEITNDRKSEKIIQIIPWLRCGDLGFLNPEIENNRSVGSPKHFPEYQKLSNDEFVKGIEFLKKI